jgi:putative ATP-dependent endonuclease of OLD family
MKRLMTSGRSPPIARLDSSAPIRSGRSFATVRALVVLEGQHDIEFLRRISQVLCKNDCGGPTVSQLEDCGQIILVPCGGGDIVGWADRFRPLDIPEVHIYDREEPPETDVRREAVRQVTARRGCRGFLTRKRAMENYLHSAAIRGAGDVSVAFGDFDSVPDLIAERRFQQRATHTRWYGLPRRARKRLANRAKRWLNRSAVDQMTPALLAKSDPHGDIASWLATITRLATAR